VYSVLVVLWTVCLSRSHFEAAKKAWEEYGVDSEMFIIIIDEIDAICKPRGTHLYCKYGSTVYCIVCTIQLNSCILLAI